MIIFTARIESNGPGCRELAQALHTWTAAVRHEAGVLRSHVYEDMESPGVFNLTSHWSSSKALERHFGGPEFGIMLGALELLARPPLVIVTEVVDESEQAAFLRVRRLRDRIRHGGPSDPARGDVH